MTKEEFKKASSYWTEREEENVKMDTAVLKKAIQAYIESNNTCALATGQGADIRCTPIEYVYSDECFYLFSEGGLKFRGLEQNEHVSIAVFDKYGGDRQNGFGALKGMQVFGTACIIEPFSEEYLKAAALRKIPVEALKNLPNTMYLIKIVPTRIDVLNSDFKKDGFASRQFIEY